MFLLKLAGPTFFNSRKVKSNKYTGIHKQQYNHQDTGYLGHKLTGYGTSEQLPGGGGGGCYIRTNVSSLFSFYIKAKEGVMFSLGNRLC